jgi:hypothetical protein
MCGRPAATGENAACHRHAPEYRNQSRIENPVLVQRFAAAGLETTGGTPQAFEQLIRSEIPKWRKAVTAANIKVD